jgi:hypothetical protein
MDYGICRINYSEFAMKYRLVIILTIQREKKQKKKTCLLSTLTSFIDHTFDKLRLALDELYFQWQLAGPNNG